MTHIFHKYNYLTSREYKTCEIQTENIKKPESCYINNKSCCEANVECAQKAHPCGAACLFLLFRNSCFCQIHAGMTSATSEYVYILQKQYIYILTFLFSSTCENSSSMSFRYLSYKYSQLGINELSPLINHKTNR